MLWNSTHGFADAGALALTAVLAFLLDLVLGDPDWLYRRIAHPVALIGKAIEVLDRRLNRQARGRESLFWRGAMVTVFLVLAAAGFAWLVALALQPLPGGVLLEALLASSLIAYRSLHDHVRAVVLGLRRSLDSARDAVAKIVGRDPRRLDGHGVARAAVESLAENLSDGVVAPLFWYLFLGLPGLLAYKTINTLDSMIGYRNARYEAFGKVAARLDDGVNWLPARITGLLVVAAALFLPAADPKRAFRILLRDAPKHRSPNAGWPEAAFAGALGFALAGPRRYGGETIQDSWMGEGRQDLSADDLERAITLYRLTGLLLMLLLLSTFVLAAR